MAAYSKAYLEEVIENQGKLFDYVASNYPDMDTKELQQYFQETDGYELKKGMALNGFLPDWIGEFYAYYQWQYGISSKNLIDKVPLDYLKKAYAGLHDLDLADCCDSLKTVYNGK